MSGVGIGSSLHVLDGDLLNSCVISARVTVTKLDSWQSVSGRFVHTVQSIAQECGVCRVVRIHWIFSSK